MGRGEWCKIANRFGNYSGGLSPRKIGTRPNPMTDGFFLKGMRRVARSLRRACKNGAADGAAREDMALAAIPISQRRWQLNQRARASAGKSRAARW
jgi:hypothetical protein